MMDILHYLSIHTNGKITKDAFNWYQATGILDAQGKLIYVSENHKDATGFEPDEILGTKLSDRIHPLDMPYIHDKHIEMLNTRNAVECKFQVKMKDGLYYTVRSLVIPQYNEDGDFVGSIFMGRRRTVDINLFRQTHILSPLPFRIAI